jgi:peptidylprolyl isomerase
MKKSEKAKGKEKAAARRRQYWIAGIAVVIAAVVIIVAYLVFANPYTARAGDTVSIYYTGSFDNGTVFQSNFNGTPFSFTLGGGTVIPGLDEAVTGMTAGQTKTVAIPVDKAYGPYNPALVQTVPLSLFPANATPSPGDRAYQRLPDGTERLVTVVNVTSAGVTVDANFPLAGQNLTFTIKVASIQKGSTESTSGSTS